MRAILHDRRSQGLLASLADALKHKGILLVSTTQYLPEHLATHGGAGPADDPPGVDILTGKDGDELAAALRAAGLLPG